MFQPATPSTVAAFLAICAAIVTAFLAAVWRSAQKEGVPPARRTGAAALVLTVWLGISASLVGSGWLGADPARRIPLFGAATMLMILVAAFSRLGRWLAGAPLPALVLFQGFRLPLELVLHAWVRQGVIPGTMTWTGANWDVIAGTLAILMAPAARRRRAAAWLFNAIGLALLLNVMRVAILSSPLPLCLARRAKAHPRSPPPLRPHCPPLRRRRSARPPRPYPRAPRATRSSVHPQDGTERTAVTVPLPALPLPTRFASIGSKENGSVLLAGKAATLPHLPEPLRPPVASASAA